MTMPSPWPARLSEPARALLIELLSHGPASRAQLSRTLLLSPTSLTRLTRQLIEADLVVECGGPHSLTGSGRPSQPLDIDTDWIHVIGINLTGTTLTAVRTDLRTQILEEVTAPLADRQVETVIGQIVDQVAEFRQHDSGIALVGVSLAGPISSRAAMVCTSPFLGWNEVPLASMISQRSGLMTVVDNDVRALTAAEHWFGAAADCRDFALVTIGAGIGCGIVVNNALVEGVHGGSGQLGHLPVTSGGPLCERGHRGCARSYLATNCLLGHAKVALGTSEIDYHDLLGLVTDGDQIACALAHDAAIALGTVIGAITATINPAKVLVSGEGVDLLASQLDTVRNQANHVKHWAVPAPDIEITPFQSSEWARGAAAAALRRALLPGGVHH